MKKIFVFILFTIYISSTSGQVLTHLDYGPHGVGFMSSLEFDYSRPARNQNQFGRSVQINVWYPAKVSQAKAMSLNDYIYLIGKEDSLVIGDKNNKASLKQFQDFPMSQGVDVNTWNAVISNPKSMKAKKDASFKNGDYPVVHFIHGSAVDYSMLGEFLASHGMIAINVPYKGYQQNSFDVNVLGMETEIRDQEFALDYVVRKLKVSPKKIGLVGISFGGQSAVGMAVRNPMVKGIISLDGGIGSTFGPQLLAGFPFYSLEKVNMPILHLYNPEDKGGNVDWFDVCQYTDRYLIAFNNMDHSFFGIYGWLDQSIPYVLGNTRPRPGDNAEAILSYSLTFLKGIFSESGTGLSSIVELDNQNSWMKPGVQSKTFKKKAFVPLPGQYLFNLMQSKGVSAVEEARQKQASITTMPITDGSYRTLFLDRFSKQEKTDMLKIVELYETDFPLSALPKYFQGQALQVNARSDEAKICFRKCLELLAADQSLTSSEKEAYKSRCENFLND